LISQAILMSQSHQYWFPASEWIHVVDQYGDRSHETWHSKVNDNSAYIDEERIEFRDHAGGVYDSYNVAEGVLYRVPEYMPGRPTRYIEMAEITQRVLSDNKLPEDPLQVLTFLGRERNELELLDQTLDTVREGDESFIDYRLTIREPKTAAVACSRFRLDADTKRLISIRTEGTSEVKPFIWEMAFNYPDSGPASVFDLGVDRSVKVIDRRLTPDIEQIVDALRRGRKQMDDYRAIVVDQMQHPKHTTWLGHENMIMYRKGKDFRVDTAHWLGGLSDWIKSRTDNDLFAKPPDGADMSAWWRARAKAFIYFPYYLSNPTMVCHVRAQMATDADGNEYFQVGELTKTRKPWGKPGHALPPYHSRMAEFVCRPPLGLPSQNRQPVLIESPSEGAVSTILLEVRETSPLPSCSAPNCTTSRPQPNLHRFWLDPSRDFVVVRSDMVAVDEAGGETVVHCSIIEELDQSPNGTWYAKRMRLKACRPDQHDEVFEFYLDFDVDLPESMFEVPRVGDRLS
jgi:hypothetical protein